MHYLENYFKDLVQKLVPDNSTQILITYFTLIFNTESYDTCKVGNDNIMARSGICRVMDIFKL